MSDTVREKPYADTEQDLHELLSACSDGELRQLALGAQDTVRAQVATEILIRRGRSLL